MTRLLVVDDDEHIRELVEQYQTGGNGLGLSIVRISVQCQLGEQTTFFVTLPLELGEVVQK